MSELEKKHQRIYDLLHAETKPKLIFLPYTKQRKNFFRKRAFTEKDKRRIVQKKNEKSFFF